MTPSRSPSWFHCLYAALAVCACEGSSAGGDAAPFDAGPNVADRACAEHSGTRILRRLLVAPDGAFIRMNLWDELLGVACKVARYGGGDVGPEGTYCVPDTAAGTVYYRDAGCTDPYIVFGLADSKSFGWEIDQSACIGTPWLYAAGSELDAPASAAHYRDALGNCQPTEVPVNDAYFYAVDRRIETGELVAMIEDTVGQGRVVQRRFSGSDGSVVCGATHDQTFAADCSMTDTDAPGSFHCTPLGQPVRELFSDAACSSAVSAVELGDCPDASATHARWRSPDSAECGRRPVFVSELEAVTTDAHYAQAGGECQLLGTPGVTRFAHVGAEVAAETVPDFRYVDEVSSTRLRRRFLATDGGLAVFDGLWHDTALGIDCRHDSVTESGALYCLPWFPDDVRSLYVDETCTDAVTVVIDTGASCDPAPKFAVDRRGEMPKVWSLEPRADPVYSAFPGPGCTIVEGVAYELVDEVGISAFVRLESVIE